MVKVTLESPLGIKCRKKIRSSDRDSAAKFSASEKKKTSSLGELILGLLLREVESHLHLCKALLDIQLSEGILDNASQICLVMNFFYLTTKPTRRPGAQSVQTSLTIYQ